VLYVGGCALVDALGEFGDGGGSSCGVKVWVDSAICWVSFGGLEMGVQCFFCGITVYGMFFKFGLGLLIFCAGRCMSTLALYFATLNLFQAQFV
jgi:hypothetical protein